MSYSLQGRALFIASLVLALFLGATGLVLDEAFEDSAEAAMRDGLEGYAETLKAAIENEHLEGLETLPETMGHRLGPIPGFMPSCSGNPTTNASGFRNPPRASKFPGLPWPNSGVPASTRSSSRMEPSSTC